MTNINDQLVLICGESGTGKSTSLMNLPNQERVMYLNCEAGKRLPFRNKFKNFTILHPQQVLEAFDHAQGNPDFDVIIIDTLSFLLDMYVSQEIMTVPAEKRRAVWPAYKEFFKTLMQEKVAASDKSVIFLAHTKEFFDEKNLEMKVSVPCNGSIRDSGGVEPYFSTVITTKKVPVKELANFKSDLLKITERDEMLGYKHVFQTQLTKSTVGERIRAPIGMFTTEQTYIDNDAALLLDHLKAFYA